MKYYKASLSNKESFILDEQDYNKLVAGMNSGSFVKLKQAIINPSFLVMILPVSQEVAMKDVLPERDVDGYIDEDAGVYKITKDITPAVAQLVDKFSV
jgi:hypothetical protein